MIAGKREITTEKLAGSLKSAKERGSKAKEVKRRPESRDSEKKKTTGHNTQTGEEKIDSMLEKNLVNGEPEKTGQASGRKREKKILEEVQKQEVKKKSRIV